MNFVRAVSKNSFTLAALPSTSDAGHHHSLHTLLEHGWRRTTTRLDAVRMAKESPPDVLLKNISCICKKGCRFACVCRKIGYKCSILCLHSAGMSCENILDQIALDDDNTEFAENVHDRLQDDEDQT
ncbi:unnamed protein product [Psylliodes chrysocephalus]|uniref:Tesmin/TSO1-like CXC domain-containing protein n=1 Tax=Psylliodes chrysocephalus TaxID=3402493 RepID=A0A9P0D0Y7_9CUCU|nr:unnamed protein product [Psylliodes chrysocephala]